MKLPMLSILAAAVALTGCTSPASLFAEKEKSPTPIEQANAYVPVVSPMPSDFCDRVGFSARQVALQEGFDAATQNRMALQNSQQCARFTTTQIAGL
jgi:hypothetical protein